MTSDRLSLFGVLLAALISVVCAVYGQTSGTLPVVKLLNTGSVLMALASILQLRLAGWFDAVMSEYGDETKYPYGPPSYVTRQIIDDPDRPVRTSIRNYLFFDANFGAHLAIASLVIAAIAIWSD